jgi:hypothetical protein
MVKTKKKEKKIIVKEIHEVLGGILELPKTVQNCVTDDILESAKTRVSTIKKIVTENPAAAEEMDTDES